MRIRPNLKRKQYLPQWQTLPPSIPHKVERSARRRRCLVLRLYQFLTTFTVQSGPDKGKPVLDGNAVSDKDFIRAVMHADYSTAYQNCVKGKMRCVITLLSKAYFKDWKEYRTAAARSTGLTAESLAKYNVEKTFISRLRELLPMIR